MRLSRSSSSRIASRSSTTLALYSIVFVDALGFGLLIPILPFLALHFGAAAAVVTQIAAAYYLAAFIASPWLGHLSDRIGRLPVLVLTVLVSVISCVGLLISASMAGLIVFRALGGAASGNSAIAQALITDDLPKEQHTTALSSLAAIRNVGNIGGPTLGGLVIALAGQHDQFKAVLWLATILAVATAALTLWSFGRKMDPAAIWAKVSDLRASARPNLEAPRPHRLAVDRSTLWPIVATATVAFPTGLLFSVSALYVDRIFGWGGAQTGLLLGICTAAIIVSRLVVVPWLSKRFSIGFNMAAMGTVACLATLFVPLAPNPIAFTLVYVAFSVTCSNALIFAGAAVSMRAAPLMRGRLLGINQAAFSLALVASASLNGVIFGYAGPAAPFYLGATILLLFASACWGVVYEERRRTSSD